MTLIDIKNMSDDEFISMLELIGLLNEKELINISKIDKDNIAIYSLTIGSLSSTAMVNGLYDLIDNTVISIVAWIISFSVLTASLNKMMKKVKVKSKKNINNNYEKEKSKFLEVKRRLDALSDEELLLLNKTIDNTKILESLTLLRETRVSNLLNVNFTDNEKELSYSIRKNINKKN